MKQKVLFVCIHNSARSQMAEAYLRHYGDNLFIADSAGIEPGKLNPFVVEVMRDDGIDISHHFCKDVWSLHKQGRSYEYVITVCDPKAAQQCPVFPGNGQRIQWSIDDPSLIAGSKEEILNGTKKIRDLIKNKVLEFIEMNKNNHLNKP